MEKARMFLIYFLFGSTLYGLIEIAYRNRTHWSMLILGGTALYAIYEFSNSFPKKSLAGKCLISTAFITMLELFTGILVNLIFKMNVWDYRNMPFNILGQICPIFSALWFLISIPANAFVNCVKAYTKNKWAAKRLTYFISFLHITVKAMLS